MTLFSEDSGFSFEAKTAGLCFKIHSAEHVKIAIFGCGTHRLIVWT